MPSPYGNLPYSGTTPTGGDSLTEDLNVFYTTGDISWILTSTALVLLMIPGIGFFYSGLARRKSALSLLWLALMSAAVVSFQWFLWGYSLTYSHNAGPFIGKLDNIGLRSVLGAPSVGSTHVPDLLFCVYQGMFAAVTVALTDGAVSERGRVFPCLVFMFIWTTIVYNPIACWHWNPRGWVYRLGGIDFAGGTPVHITAGAAALAYSYVLGKRTGYGTQKLNYRPNNVTHIVLGTVFLWVGWFGFNAGSALSANLRAVMAAVNTNLAASVGGITWCVIDYRLEKNWSTVSFCSGVLSALVVITPGAGYVPAWAAVIFGVSAGVVCNFATRIKYWLRVDDTFDIFAVHGVGGFLGVLLTGIFAADYIAHLDGNTMIPGGWLNRNWIQVAYQLAASTSGMVYSFAVTTLILICMSVIGRFIPAFRLRVDVKEEEIGIDEVEIGEFAYDYVEAARELRPVETHDDMEEASGVSETVPSRTPIAAKETARSDSYPLETVRRWPADQTPKSTPSNGPYGQVRGTPW